jgi:predicted nucleic-acid-binding Zn-ribbon protein
MTDVITRPVAGGCPKCRTPTVPVPEDYTSETVITCPECGYSAPQKDFFENSEAD